MVDRLSRCDGDRNHRASVSPSGGDVEDDGGSDPEPDTGVGPVDIPGGVKVRLLATLDDNMVPIVDVMIR